MKNYEKLIVPEDSAWNRKTLSARIWRNTNWRIRDFLTSCNNIIKWAPTIWKDRDWDDGFILDILQKKIEFQRKEIIYANRHTQVDRDNRDMTIVLNLIERVKEEYYNTEYLDYEESKFRFEDVEEGEDLKRLEIDVLSERYDEFLMKYPSGVRKVLRDKPDLDKRDLCFYVSHYNQEKAHDLLFRVLRERMRWWWD
jgi:hypothetical protein